MSRHTPKDKVDANQAEIVASLRALGAKVLDTHALGKGAPDIFVLWRDNTGWIPLEIKARGGRLTEDEIIWWDRMGYAEPLIAHDDQEAARLCGISMTVFDRNRKLGEPYQQNRREFLIHEETR